MYLPSSKSCNGRINGVIEPPNRSLLESRNNSNSTLNGHIGLRAPAYAFILPNLEQYPDDFRRFLERDMIEISTLRRLENSGHLNWWCLQDNNQRLWPLVTTGDGNCLLHAASLGIWGVHDRQLYLRNTLYEVLRHGSRKHAIYRRWRWHESKTNLQSELILSEEEWRKEWSDILDMAAATPRINTSEESGSSSEGSQEQIYESLECIHVFALAHILKRPIIVVADTILRNANGEELAPIPFGGIYLPLECPPEQCHRSPLLLCYDASHFSALVAMRQTISTSLQAIPITDKNRNLLPVHFSVDPGPDFTWWRDNDDHRIAAEIDALQSDDRKLELISRYMDIVRMDLRRGSVKRTTPWSAATTAGSSHGIDQNAPYVPDKLLTLATGGGNGGAAHQKPGGGAVGTSRILKEIRQHFRWLGRKNRRKSSAMQPAFSPTELLQSNCVLTVLLHNYAHQYIDSMVSLYINEARERFEKTKMIPPSFTPKNRMSRSFSTSSVLLTCLNNHCQRVASPSTNFLCSLCFEDQRRELKKTLIGHINSNYTSPTATTVTSTCSAKSAVEVLPAQNGTNTISTPSPAKQLVEALPNPGQNLNTTSPVMNGTNPLLDSSSKPKPPPLMPKPTSAAKKSFHRYQPSYDSALRQFGQAVTGDYCVDHLRRQHQQHIFNASGFSSPQTNHANSINNNASPDTHKEQNHGAGIGNGALPNGETNGPGKFRTPIKSVVDRSAENNSFVSSVVIRDQSGSDEIKVIANGPSPTPPERPPKMRNGERTDKSLVHVW